jgi:DUF1680 family protein
MLNPICIKGISFPALICSLTLLRAYGQDSTGNPFAQIRIIPENLSPLPLSAIRPTGWLKIQLQENLSGFTGHLDELVPDLIRKDDIYGADRLSNKVSSKNVGALSDAPKQLQAQFLWWNSETQSNWWDGFIRTAILINDKPALKKANAYIHRILSTQDADGYLGIYDKDLRYKFTGENGELWSKTTLLRGMLAWYDYTRDPVVLKAVKRGVDNELANYPIDASQPFYSKNPYVGGLTHGLVFTDILERLYRITKDRRYLDYCLFLYRDFSRQDLNEDAQYKKLIDTSLLLNGHGVHTYEHLRAVAAAFYASGNPALKNALTNFEKKIAKTTTPSGGPAGDEFIGKRLADATSTAYEYCSMNELLDSYISLMIKSGEPTYADRIERLFFNAAQGSRHPTESAICYLKTDNSYELTGGKNGDTADKNQTRYRYSPVHKEAAVCCVPNAGRIGPAYIQNMWMRAGNAVIAALLGPCDLSFIVDTTRVRIQELTQYPFENFIKFRVTCTHPARFELRVRMPSWTDKVRSGLPCKIENGFIIVDRQWATESSFTIQFETPPAKLVSQNNSVYFTSGSLVLARPIPAQGKITKRYPFGRFSEINYLPDSRAIYEYIGKPVTPDAQHPLRFHTRMRNAETDQEEDILLEPMGGTILRQVTFKDDLK